MKVIFMFGPRFKFDFMPRGESALLNATAVVRAFEASGNSKATICRES
jgi:hypothetical protein